MGKKDKLGKPIKFDQFVPGKNDMELQEFQEENISYKTIEYQILSEIGNLNLLNKKHSEEEIELKSNLEQEPELAEIVPILLKTVNAFKAEKNISIAPDESIQDISIKLITLQTLQKDEKRKRIKLQLDNWINFDSDKVKTIVNQLPSFTEIMLTGVVGYRVLEFLCKDLNKRGHSYSIVTTQQVTHIQINLDEDLSSDSTNSNAFKLRGIPICLTSNKQKTANELITALKKINQWRSLMLSKEAVIIDVTLHKLDKLDDFINSLCKLKTEGKAICKVFCLSKGIREALQSNYTDIINKMSVVDVCQGISEKVIDPWNILSTCLVKKINSARQSCQKDLKLGNKTTPCVLSYQQDRETLLNCTFIPASICMPLKFSVLEEEGYHYIYYKETPAAFINLLSKELPNYRKLLQKEEIKSSIHALFSSMWQRCLPPLKITTFQDYQQDSTIKSLLAELNGPQKNMLGQHFFNSLLEVLCEREKTLDNLMLIRGIAKWLLNRKNNESPFVYSCGPLLENIEIILQKVKEDIKQKENINTKKTFGSFFSDSNQGDKDVPDKSPQGKFEKK